jgi:hypothetical protein
MRPEPTPLAAWNSEGFVTNGGTFLLLWNILAGPHVKLTDPTD